jgi:hypothetical protein
MSGQTYTYKPSITTPNGPPLPVYNNEATILVENVSQYHTVVGSSFQNKNGSFEDLITSQSYDISLVFQTTPPSNITEIYIKAFLNCPGLRFVTLPPSLTTIRQSAFAIPDGTTLTGTEGLSAVTFTDIANSKLANIGAQAFVNQSNLSSITLPASVSHIEQDAFKKTGLTTLTFDDIDNSQLTFLGPAAFQNTSLISVIIPADLTRIYPGAFSFISSLTDVSFNNIALSRLETINAEAFKDTNIGTITIPNLVKKIATTAFTGITGMTVKMNSKAAGALDITVPQSSVSFRGATNVTIEADENTYEYTPGTSVPTDPPSSLPTSGYGGEPTILVNNSSVTNNIPVSAFFSGGVGLITAAYGPAALVFANGSTTKSIGDEAFKDCLGLKHITIPDSITTIGTNAFTGSGLQKVYISRTTAAVLGVTVTQNATFYGATGVTIVEYPVVTTPPPAIIFPYPKNEKNKRLLGVNQKISSGLARPNFKFQTNQFSAGRSRTAQSKQKANGPFSVIFPIR